MDVQGADEGFTRDWAAVRDGIARFCWASTGNRADAEDLLQIVAIRAWRGYPSFTGTSSFATWVRAIARNEAARFAGGVARRKESSIDADHAAAATAVAAAHRQAERIGASDHDLVLDRLSRDWLRSALGPLLDEAVADGALSAVEADVLRARAADDDVDWAMLAPRWGVSPAHCAVLHFRAKDKVRVFLFRARPEVLGGREALRAAFAAARDGTPPLTPAEAEAFEMVVLQGRGDYRRRGWPGHLRSAVNRVARQSRLAEW